MPIFSYVCKDCNEKFDLFLQGSKKDEKLVCKKCGGKNIQRIFSSFGIGSKSSSDSDKQQSTCPTGTCPF
jgi:putative FmdB family regulatory protein